MSLIEVIVQNKKGLYMSHVDRFVCFFMWECRWYNLCIKIMYWDIMTLMMHYIHFIKIKQTEDIHYPHLEDIWRGSRGEVECLAQMLLRVVPRHVAIDHDGFRCSLLTNQQHRLLLFGNDADEEI